MKSTTLKFNPIACTDIQFHIYQHHVLQLKKRTANVWKFKAGNNAKNDVVDVVHIAVS